MDRDYYVEDYFVDELGKIAAGKALPILAGTVAVVMGGAIAALVAAEKGEKKKPKSKQRRTITYHPDRSDLRMPAGHRIGQMAIDISSPGSVSPSELMSQAHFWHGVTWAQRKGGTALKEDIAKFRKGEMLEEDQHPKFLQGALTELRARELEKIRR